MTTVTRRNALSSGTLAAIAAGLIGTTPKPAEGAPPAPKRDTAYMDELTISSQTVRARLAESLDMLADAERDLCATLTPDQLVLFLNFESTHSFHYITGWEAYTAELARHLPGMAPALVALWSHIADGGNTPVECCRTTDWGGTDEPPAA